MQALTFFFAFVAVLALIGVGGLAGSPIRHQPPWRQHQSRPDAAAGRDRCRRGRRPPAAGAGPARQRRTSADDRRSDRHRGRTQYRARHARHAISCRRGRPSPCELHRSPGSRRCPMPPAGAMLDAAEPIGFDHAEPPMPEPPPRPARPAFADEVRRPRRRRAPSERAQRSRWPASRREPLGESVPEPRPRAAEPRPSRCRRDRRRIEPSMPRGRAERTAEAAAAMRAPERAAAAAATSAAAPPPPMPSSADQNLAEMAQRLEAALRRPAGESVSRRCATPPVAAANRRLPAPRLRRSERRRQPRPARRAALKISKTRWPRCSAVRRLLRETPQALRVEFYS